MNPTVSASPDEQLLELIHGTRAVYLRALEEALTTRDTTGSCLYACVLLKQALVRFVQVPVAIRGGGDGVSGYFDGSAWHGHYWLEVTTPHRGVWVVDITADQFGGPAVVVLPLSSSRARYRPEAQQETDAQVADFVEELGSSRPAV